MLGTELHTPRKIWRESDRPDSWRRTDTGDMSEERLASNLQAFGAPGSAGFCPRCMRTLFTPDERRAAKHGRAKLGQWIADHLGSLLRGNSGAENRS